MRTLEDQIKDIRAKAEMGIEYVKAEALRKEQRVRECDAAAARVRQERSELKARLEEENGTAGMLKADLLWEKALEGADSLGDVEWRYNELVELIK